MDKYITQEFKQKLRDICLQHLNDNTTLKRPDGWNSHSERLCRRDIKRELRKLSERLYYVQLKKDKHSLGDYETNAQKTPLFSVNKTVVLHSKRKRFELSIHKFSEEFIRRLKCESPKGVNNG